MLHSYIDRGNCNINLYSMLNARAIRFTIFLTFSLGLLICSHTVYAQNNIGWLEVKSTASSIGADIYIDGKFASTVPARLKVSAGKHTISIQRDFYENLEKAINIQSGQNTCLTAELRRNAKVLKIATQEDAEIWIDGKVVAIGSYSDLISFGEHTFESRLQGCRGHKEQITINAHSAESITLPAPQPIVGSIKITSNIPASVEIDDQHRGTTPIYIDSDITVGMHLVKISANNHRTIERVVEISEGICTELNEELSELVSVDFKSKPSASLLSINGEIVGTTPHPIQLETGEYDIEVFAKNYVPTRKTIKVTSKEKNFEFKLKRQFLKPSGFYISGEYQLLALEGIKGSLGGFIKNVNLEANVIYGLKESETIYWNSPNEMTEPSGYTYKPLYVGGRLGYSFIVGTRLRITPQVGAGIVMLKGTKVSDGVSDPKTTDGYCIPGLVGARIDFAIVPSVAICVMPNYSFSIMESKLYSQLSPASKTIKGYANGVSASAGLCFFF